MENARFHFAKIRHDVSFCFFFPAMFRNFFRIFVVIFRDFFASFREFSRIFRDILSLAPRNAKHEHSHFEDPGDGSWIQDGLSTLFDNIEIY